MPTLKRFKDYERVKGQWYEKKLTDMVMWGVVNGYPDGTIRPDRYEGFIETVVMLHRVITQEPEKRMKHDLLRYVTIVNGGGSGFWLPDWHVVTNAHVAFEDPDTQREKQFIDGNPALGFAPRGFDSLDAEIVRVDHVNDLALLKVEPPHYKDEIEMHHFTIDDMEDQLIKGDMVITGGQPFGNPWDVTDGDIRSTARWVQVWRQPQVVYGTDLATNPGNSGGPVTSIDGKLVAVVNAGRMGANLYNYLIPVYHVWRLWDGLDPARINGDIK